MWLDDIFSLWNTLLTGACLNFIFLELLLSDLKPGCLACAIKDVFSFIDTTSYEEVWHFLYSFLFFLTIIHFYVSFFCTKGYSDQAVYSLDWWIMTGFEQGSKDVVLMLHSQTRWNHWLSEKLQEFLKSHFWGLIIQPSVSAMLSLGFLGRLRNLAQWLSVSMKSDLCAPGFQFLVFGSWAPGRWMGRRFLWQSRVCTGFISFYRPCKSLIWLLFIFICICC